MREVVAVAAPYWAGEAEVVEAYLATHRSRARDLVWLRAQAWKETRHLRALPDDRRATFLATGVVLDHPEGSSAAKLHEEMKHFRLIAALIEERTGTAVAVDALVELPHETRLQAVRAPYRRGTPLERAAVDFTEGGGGAMYAVLARLDGDPFDRRVATAFREIHADEVFHGPAEIHTIARHARDADDWRHAVDVVERISRARLHMRNEMFSFPLAESRLSAIAAGEITPWPMPVAL